MATIGKIRKTRGYNKGQEYFVKQSTPSDFVLVWQPDPKGESGTKYSRKWLRRVARQQFEALDPEAEYLIRGVK